MSGIYEASHLFDPRVGVCFGYEDDFWYNWMSILDFYPLFISFGICVLMLGFFEVMHWIWSCVLFAVMGVAYGLAMLIGDSDNLQPEACPLRQEQMPAQGAMLITAIWVVGFLLLAMMTPMRTRSSIVVPMTALGVILIYTRVFLIFNTSAQILAGAGMGAAIGIVYSYIIYCLQKWDTLNAIVAIPELTWFGRSVDTMTDQKHQTIWLDKYDTLTVMTRNE